MTDPLDALYWRDEILQVLFWLRGEGLGEAVTPGDLEIFLQAEQAQIRQHLEQMAADGYLARLEESPVRYRLTEWGVTEGGRRFADEFAGLTGQGHGECNNPNCSCQTLGPEACESRVGPRH